MAEPHASTAVGALVGAGLSMGGMFLGAQIDALVVGLLPALFVSIWLDAIDNRIKAAAAVMFSAMLAGYGSPAIAAWASSAVHGLPDLRLLGAFLIGAFGPLLFPAIVSRAKQLIEVAKP